MESIKVIITGATGMVGEGVLFECLKNENVSEVLIINRKTYLVSDPKLKQLIVPDFFKLEEFANFIKGYDACFFCAGISSVGMKEEKYKWITYDTTISFAKTLLNYNKEMTFTYVSGSHTDSSEKGKLMWARVKGKTENDLANLGFKAEYNFRPGIMLPFKEQKNWNKTYKFLGKIFKVFSAERVLTMEAVGKAMISCVINGYEKNVLEIDDIKKACTLLK